MKRENEEMKIRTMEKREGYLKVKERRGKEKESR